MQGGSNAPFRVLLAVALLCVATVFAAAALTRAPPWLGLRLAADAASHRVKVDGVVEGGPAAAALAGKTPVWLTAVDGVTLTDADKIEESDFMAAYADVEALFGR